MVDMIKKIILNLFWWCLRFCAKKITRNIVTISESQHVVFFFFNTDTLHLMENSILKFFSYL